MATVTAKEIANHIEAVTVVLNGVDGHEEMHAGVVTAQGGQLETLIKASSLDMHGIALQIVMHICRSCLYNIYITDGVDHVDTTYTYIYIYHKRGLVRNKSYHH